MTRGADLARRYFEQAVRPIVEREAGEVRYLAGGLGTGSEVLGLDDEVSQDHDFGCRLTVLVDEDDAGTVQQLHTALEACLPGTFEGRLVRFATSRDPLVRHRVDIHTVQGFARSRLGVETTSPMAVADWLCLTGQSVLEVVGGPVFHDSTRGYAALVGQLRWYPDDVWLYVLASGWTRVSQELPLVGRTAVVGDGLGSRVVAGRIARDVMHLAFLIERRWSPYPKWAGTALRQLPTGPALSASLQAALATDDLHVRHERLAEALESLADRQAAVGLPCVRPAVRPFFDRNFSLTIASDIPVNLATAIREPEVRRLPLGLGSIEQWCDNVDLLSSPARRHTAREFCRALAEGPAVAATDANGPIST